MPSWIVLVTIMVWLAFLPEVRAETALVPLYQDLLQNCKGASESTRERIIRTAFTSGRGRTLQVSSAIIRSFLTGSLTPIRPILLHLLSCAA